MILYQIMKDTTWLKILITIWVCVRQRTGKSDFMDYRTLNARIERIADVLGVEHQLYKNYKATLKALNVNYVEKLDKQGNYIIRVKKGISDENLNKLLNKQTLQIHLKEVKTNLVNKEIDRLIREGYTENKAKKLAKKPSRSEIIKETKKNSNIKNFIEEHSEDIYKIAELNEAVHRQTKLTDEEVNKLFHMYDGNKNYTDYIPGGVTEKYEY